MNLNTQEIQKMRSVNFGAVEQFKNPYCFRYGDMAIKLEFAEDGPTLQELLTAFFLRQKSGL